MVNEKTLGSLFAGVGGFDLGFERAGWRSVWQVEINPVNRACLADRFPHARQFEDVRLVGAKELPRVDCLTAGFPCQDISTASQRGGKAQGLKGGRSGLFSEVLRIIDETQPRWVVLENVPNLLACNDSQDIEHVIRELARRDYLGSARVLDARYFGVPQARRRIYMVAGLGRPAPLDFVFDALPVDPLPCSLAQEQKPRREDEFAGHTLTASNAPSRITLGGEVLVAEEDGWHQMVERQGIPRLHGLRAGLDDANLAARYAAGNAVVPAVIEWIARKLD